MNKSYMIFNAYNVSIVLNNSLPTGCGIFYWQFSWSVIPNSQIHLSDTDLMILQRLEQLFDASNHQHMTRDTSVTLQ